MMSALVGKQVLLTGASGGIGAAIARRLAASGARLILVGRSHATLEALRLSLQASAGSHLSVACDLTTADGRGCLHDAIVRLERPLDVLINCAGISHFGLLPDAVPADIEAQIATNVTAPILVTRLALGFLDTTSGRVINVGSSFGGIGYPGFSTYCASKFALRGFTEALRRELGDGHLQIAYLAPRATRTALNSAAVCAMNDALGNTMDPPELVAAIVERMLRASRMRDRAIGWPERLFLRLNAIFPTIVDGALRRQLGAIKRFAAATPRAFT
jgi:short-subunit dehydrogenase